jgi:hypothetical protein
VGMALHIDRNLALANRADAARWAEAHSLDQAGDERAVFAAQFIPAGARVLDLGCGRMSLKGHLPNGCHYQGVDLVARDEETIVCDFNAGEFPTEAAAQADIVVMLGLLETIADVESLFTHLRFCKRDIVLTYCATDLTGKCDREALGFINSFSFFELARLFDRYGFRIACTAPFDGVQMLMRLTTADRLAPATPCSVAVVSDGAGGFGHPLALQMINALLPGEADVHHLTFDTLARAREAYDLVVIGTGGSLFQPLIAEDVLDIAGRGKAAIGIFGTRYRELVPRLALDRLIERLDTWFARYQDDVLMYGRGRNNVEHLGDWLIDLFPLTTATDDAPLRIGETTPDCPPDIETIQRHKRVFSSDPRALLCALTSAELAAYVERPAGDMPHAVPGHFRSMLIDIFGRSFPEKEFFMIDRDAVTRYKARVHRNVMRVGERIEAILRNVAVAA